MPKNVYNLVFINKQGEKKILSNEDFTRFQKRFNKIGKYFNAPDTLQEKGFIFEHKEK